jgi:hypothetical protein
MKLFTSLSLIVGFLLLVSWPWIVGKRPPAGSPRSAYAAYSRRAAGYVGGLVVCMVASGVGATLVIRRAREEYRQQAMANLKGLVEGSLQDHQKKEGDAEPQR